MNSSKTQNSINFSATEDNNTQVLLENNPNKLWTFFLKPEAADVLEALSLTERLRFFDEPAEAVSEVHLSEQRPDLLTAPVMVVVQVVDLLSSQQRRVDHLHLQSKRFGWEWPEFYLGI